MRFLPVILLCLCLFACERKENTEAGGAKSTAQPPPPHLPRRAPEAIPTGEEETLAHLAKKHPKQALAFVIQQANGDEAALRKGFAVVLDEMIGDYLERPTGLFMQTLYDENIHLPQEDHWIYLGEFTKALTRRDPNKAWLFFRENWGDSVDTFSMVRGQSMFSELVESQGFTGAIDFFRERVPEASPFDVVSVLLPHPPQFERMTPEMMIGTLALLDQQHGEPDFEKNLGSVSQQLANSDPDAFANWLNRQPQEDQYISGYWEVAESLAERGRIKEAAAWIARITDPEKKELAKQGALSRATGPPSFSAPPKVTDEAAVEAIRKTLDGDP